MYQNSNTVGIATGVVVEIIEASGANTKSRGKGQGEKQDGGDA